MKTQELLQKAHMFAKPFRVTEGDKFGYLSPSGYMFVEARLGDMTDAQGNGGFNAGAIGFRYDFSWKTLHTQ